MCDTIVSNCTIASLSHKCTSDECKNISLICLITRLLPNHKTYANHKTSSVLGFSMSRGFRFLETVFLKSKSEKLYTMKNFMCFTSGSSVRTKLLSFNTKNNST